MTLKLRRVHEEGTVSLFTAFEVVFKPAYYLLPEVMNSQGATALLMAIGMQESRFEHRIQLIGTQRRWWENLKGPARGWAQFEKNGGVRGVIEHPASRKHAAYVMDALRYPNDVGHAWSAIAHNDVLAGCFARLLLWTDPRPLPGLLDSPEAWWQYYLRIWRPGKPKRHTFDDFWYRALQVTNQLKSQGMWK